MLDEATSGMDYITEKVVIQNLFNNIDGKALLMVAHRLNIIKDFDTILVMKEGKIVQSGCFSQLVSDKKGYFYSLWSKNENKGSGELF